MVLVAIGLFLTVGGIAGLALVSEYKPTLENALAHGGDVLSPSGYKQVKLIATAALVAGVISLVAGLILLAAHARGRSVRAASAGFPPQRSAGR